MNLDALSWHLDVKLKQKSKKIKRFASIPVNMFEYHKLLLKKRGLYLLALLKPLTKMSKVRAYIWVGLKPDISLADGSVDLKNQ